MNRMMQLFLISSLATTLGACGGDDTTTGSGGSGGSGGNTNTGSETGGTGGTGGAGGSGGASTGGSGGSGAGGSAGYTFSVTKGFNFAESCIWDAATDSWYVSNIAPQSDDLLVEDGEGWISRLDKDGAIVEEKWVSGFDSPAGLRISKGILYVANITRVHGIDIATAAVVETHTFPSAILLNDPAVDEANGMVYVTDTFGNAIYQFKAGEIGAEDVTVASPDLKGPNGLLFEGGKLLVGSLVDFDPANLGPFLSVDLGTKAIKQIGTVTGKFDGLEPWKDGYLLSDNGVSKLVYVTPDGTSEVLYDLMKDHGFAPAADIGIDPARGIICVPNLADSVGFVKIN